MTQEQLHGFNNIRRLLSCLLVVGILLCTQPKIVQAKITVNQAENGITYSRSLESLRDLDYQTWQVVVYRQPLQENNLVLRIVGYPSTMRMDHPNSLKVNSGLRDWLLEDITLLNPELANDPREAAAEFQLSPLINDLTNNRPLRLMLLNVFNDLPVPPYVVKEWRYLLDTDFA